MTDRVRYRPFTGDADTHVRLDAAPLALVLCQVKWPELGYLQQDISPQAKALGARLSQYPLFSSAPEMSITITPQGVTQAVDGMVYTWASADRKWTVSLGRTFVTLLTKEYPGYAEFEPRLEEIITHVKDILEIPMIERVGVRYLNQISNPSLVARITDLVRPEILGFQAMHPETPDAELIQALNQAQFRAGDSIVQTRAGLIGANQSMDPSIEPLNVNSWVLDIDAFWESEGTSDVSSVLARAGKLSDTAYDFFKWVIKNGFIEEFGRGV